MITPYHICNTTDEDNIRYILYPDTLDESDIEK